MLIIVFHNFETINRQQHAKKVVSDRLGLVDFTIRLVNSALKLPIGKVNFGWNSNYIRTVSNPAHQKVFVGYLK